MQNPIIWAVDRPADTNYELTLWAYDPTQGAMLGSWPAGTWPNSPDEYSKVVPVVANGQVYVASYQQLAIFGLGTSDPPSARPAVQIAHPVFKNPIQLAAGEHDVFGTISAIDGSTITVKKRDGTTINVEATNATTARLEIDEPVRVVGSGAETALHARWVSRAKGLPKLWPADR